jgi:hypothetical protein
VYERKDLPLGTSQNFATVEDNSKVSIGNGRQTHRRITFRTSPVKTPGSPGGSTRKKAGFRILLPDEPGRLVAGGEPAAVKPFSPVPDSEQDRIAIPDTRFTEVYANIAHFLHAYPETARLPGFTPNGAFYGEL